MNFSKNIFISSKHNDLVLTFDAEKRKEFLSGFRKRKLERKAKAREELDKQIKVLSP